MVVWAVVSRLLRPAFRRVDVRREALVIETLHGELDNRLIGCLQLGEELIAADAVGRPLGHSIALVIELSRRTADSLALLKLKKLVDLTMTWRVLMGAVVIVVGWGSMVAFAGPVIDGRIERLQNAWAQVLDDLFPVEMEVEPGDIAVVRGRPVTLTVRVIGARQDTVRLIRVPIDESTLPTVTEDGTPPAPPLPEEAPQPIVDELTLSNDSASFEVTDPQQSFTYEFEYAGRRTPLHTIRVGDLPEINAINYELVFPAYTGMPTRTIVGRVPRLHALSGTSVLVSFAATTRLHPQRCFVRWSDGQLQRITVNGRFGHFQFTVDRPDRATIELTGHYGKGFEMESPLSFEVVAQRDKRPTIRILGIKETENIMFAGSAAGFGIPWIAEDDFGVTEVNLQYKTDTIDPLLQRPERSGIVPRKFDPPLDRVRGVYQGAFRELDPPLAPGDRITFWLTAKDNDIENEAGPNTGRSRSIQIVIVLPDLSGFSDVGEAGFGSGLLGAFGLLSEIERVPRALDLLVDPKKTVRTEAARELDKIDVKSRVAQESSPPGNEDATANYFDLLSGQK